MNSIVRLANFVTPTSGGLRTYLDEVGRRYVRHGHRVALVIPGPADRDEHTGAGRRVTIRGPRLPGGAGYHLLASRSRVLATLGLLRPDVLEVSDKLTLGWVAPWAAARRIPVVLFSHERLDAALAPWLPSWFPVEPAADLVNRRLARLADVVVCASAFAAAEFERAGAPRVHRLPLGVDLDTFRPAATPRPGTGRGRLLVTVSRLSREKRPEAAVECVRLLLPDGVPTRLLVIGDGPLRGELARRASGLPVRFLGHLDRAAVAHVVAAADVLVAPAPAETFGLAVLEALACGTPAVVPDRGAAPELVTPAAGVVTGGSPHELAGGVREVCARPAAGRRAGARARAEQFPWDATVAGMLAIHGGLVEAGLPRALTVS
jgi:alpha-1,6-mannosyltransferase